jgi:uncharacterized protein YjbI with pentapeptide repeats
MSDANPCGRPIHSSPTAADEEPVCLMHSRDPKKDKVEFRQEIDAILKSTSAYNRPPDKFDFTRFVFPEVDFSCVEFARDAIFRGADFAEIASFGGASFTHKATFIEVTFSQTADFPHARFTQVADFSRAKFSQGAVFRGAVFSRKADFHRALFDQVSDFKEAKFDFEADFYAATFSQNTSFKEARFKQECIFGFATFARIAEFQWTKFDQSALFSGTTFNHRTSFSGASFTNGADFRWATFIQEADFGWALFKQPTKVCFDEVNKSSPVGLRACFENCSVEEVSFTDVHWHRRKGRIILQDELDIISGESKVKKEYGLVAVAYRQLVNNFEKVRNYDLAEDCFIGVMEMKRLDPRNFLFGRNMTIKNVYETSGVARRLGGWMSLINAYRVLSNYGSSYTQALGMLGVLLLTFACFFPVFGLHMARAGVPPMIAVDSPAFCPELASVSWCRAWAHEDRSREMWKTFKAGFWAALEVATFQRRTTVVSATTWGQRLAVLEMVVIPGQFALFFLALRRRFRR